MVADAMKTTTVPLFLLIALSASPVIADTTFDTTDKYAWGTNTGWINFRHDQPNSPEGIVFGESFLSGFAYSANIGWIHFGDGSPTNGYAYSNATSDHGVNHNGSGNLSGYAWAANTGWVNFGWASSSDANRPRVDLITGAFSGYAWSANTGWINLSTGMLTTVSMHCSDTDNDTIADHWEWSNFGGLVTATALTDKDKDGVLDKDEYAAGTDPNNNASYLKIVSQSYNAGYTQITLEFTTTPSRLYRIEYDNDLGLIPAGTWTNSALGTFSPDAGATTTKTVTFPTGTIKFFRAIAIRPLPVTP
jgi:hypothetical protein